jgi:FdhE protein
MIEPPAAGFPTSRQPASRVSGSRLNELAQTDPTLGPLARLQIEALLAADDPRWEQGLPSFGSRSLVAGAPILDGQTLGVDSSHLKSLWERLGKLASQANPSETARLCATIPGPVCSLEQLVEAVVRNDTAGMEATAGRAGVDSTFLGTMAHLLAIPLLMACARKSAAMISAVTWEAGYCAVCGAWPTLAEVRGLERERWLRCGRCGCAWAGRQLVCAFCGSDDHQSQGYLASDSERDARRAETCDRCHGYLKAAASLVPLTLPDILVLDAETIELDLAALDRGYERPAEAGFSPDVRVESMGRGSRWLPWTR